MRLYHVKHFIFIKQSAKLPKYDMAKTISIYGLYGRVDRGVNRQESVVEGVGNGEGGDRE